MLLVINSVTFETCSFSNVIVAILLFILQNLQSELEKTKLKYQELEKQKTDSQGKLDDLDKEVKHAFLGSSYSFTFWYSYSL